MCIRDRYNISTKVYFGENQLGHLGEELKKFGTRVLMTYGAVSYTHLDVYKRQAQAAKVMRLTAADLKEMGIHFLYKDKEKEEFLWIFGT